MNIYTQNEELSTAVAPHLLEPVPFFREDVRWGGRPWVGGDGVYIARNMLNLDMDAIAADFAKAPPKQFADVAPSNAKLYPNPAKDEVMIEFDNRLNTSAVFEIFNFEGLKIIDILLNKGNQYISVSTKNLKAGLYMYRISDNERIIAKDKLLIVK